MIEQTFGENGDDLKFLPGYRNQRHFACKTSKVSPVFCRKIILSARAGNSQMVDIGLFDHRFWPLALERVELTVLHGVAQVKEGLAKVPPKRRGLD